ncbi:Trp biosynthesis-associated membrane protein [Nocardioides sp. YIM 152588]|uniref:Trp biosynthesis-associated membrane protein n=1 Tax=Nocardioides sp. YIM 152588 TaxID=3158259 RepID=UPI0032E465E5
MADADDAQPGRSPRRTFGPVVLAGLAGAGLAAVGGHRAMLTVPDSYWAGVGSAVFGGEAYADVNRVEFPLAGALALVALACWGVVLVARGTFRRIVAALAALAGLGIVAVVVVGGFVQDDDAAADIADRIGTAVATDVPLDPTSWMWATLVGGLLAAAAGVAAVRFAPAWPEMGSRYDAPGGSAGDDAEPAEDAAVPPEERSHLDVWKSLDEGSDPTA